MNEQAWLETITTLSGLIEQESQKVSKTAELRRAGAAARAMGRIHAAGIGLRTGERNSETMTVVVTRSNGTWKDPGDLKLRIHAGETPTWTAGWIGGAPGGIPDQANAQTGQQLATIARTVAEQWRNLVTWVAWRDAGQAGRGPAATHMGARRLLSAIDTVRHWKEETATRQELEEVARRLGNEHISLETTCRKGDTDVRVEITTTLGPIGTMRRREWTSSSTVRQSSATPLGTARIGLNLRKDRRAGPTLFADLAGETIISLAQQLSRDRRFRTKVRNALETIALQAGAEARQQRAGTESAQKDWPPWSSGAT